MSVKTLAKFKTTKDDFSFFNTMIALANNMTDQSIESPHLQLLSWSIDTITSIIDQESTFEINVVCLLSNLAIQN